METLWLSLWLLGRPSLFPIVSISIESPDGSGLSSSECSSPLARGIGFDWLSHSNQNASQDFCGESGFR